MSIDTPSSIENRLHETLRRLKAGERDPEEGKRALERLALGREEMRKRIGVVDIAVELVREARQ